MELFGNLMLSALEFVLSTLILELLLVQAGNKGPYTPLHVACMNGHTETANCLLLAGAAIAINKADGVRAQELDVQQLKRW